MTDELEPTTAAAASGATGADAGPSAAATGDRARARKATAAAPPRPTEPDDSLLAVLDRLTGLLERSDLTELEVGSGETGLILRKAAALPQVAPLAAAVGGSPGPSSAPDPAATASVEAAAARPSVKAPLTGLFYNAPGPGSAPYVQVGGEVVVGQVIGLIEAMKLFNEIKSDLAGRVVRVVAESGQLVKAKQPLIEVEPL
jgi:acetyl-CoA carboxylase biotin carboxyl carrier protein